MCADRGEGLCLDHLGRSAEEVGVTAPKCVEWHGALLEAKDEELERVEEDPRAVGEVSGPVRQGKGQGKMEVGGGRTACNTPYPIPARAGYTLLFRSG